MCSFQVNKQPHFLNTLVGDTDFIRSVCSQICCVPFIGSAGCFLETCVRSVVIKGISKT